MLVMYSKKNAMVLLYRRRIMMVCRLKLRNRIMNTATTLVISAAYNEAENIEHLVSDILARYSTCDVLIIDDNSPDGTGALVKKMMQSDSRVNLIERPGKMGYGTAYIEGFCWALARRQYDTVITMDTDYSHDPRYIGPMLEKIRSADVVIGSRYIKGGGTINWGVHRQILSRSANIYAKIILNIPVHDCTSGFRCYRRSVLEKIDFPAIRSNGYSFLEEILYSCKLLGASFDEVPIIFKDREFGKSKINRNEIIKAILLVPCLRFKKKRVGG